MATLFFPTVVVGYIDPSILTTSRYDGPTTGVGPEAAGWTTSLVHLEQDVFVIRI